MRSLDSGERSSQIRLGMAWFRLCAVPVLAFALAAGAPKGWAAEFDIAPGISARDVFLAYRSGGTFQRSLDRGLVFYGDEQAGLSYAAFSLGSDFEARQNTSNIFSVGGEFFLFHKNFRTQDDKADLAFGLAAHARMGRSFTWASKPHQIWVMARYTPSGFANRSLDRVLSAEARWQVETSPFWSVSVGGRRFQYSLIDVEGWDNAWYGTDWQAFAGFSYTF